MPASHNKNTNRNMKNIKSFSYYSSTNESEQEKPKKYKYTKDITDSQIEDMWMNLTNDGEVSLSAVLREEGDMVIEDMLEQFVDVDELNYTDELDKAIAETRRRLREYNKSRKK